MDEVIPTRSFATGGGFHVSLEQRGTTLAVSWGVSWWGRLRALLLFAIGALLLWVATKDSSLGTQLLAVVGAVLVGIAAWSSGFAVVHRFDGRRLTVERDRSYLAIPLGTWVDTIEPGTSVEVVLGTRMGRGPAVNKVRLRTTGGQTIVMTTTDLADAESVAGDIAHHLGLRRHNV